MVLDFELDDVIEKLKRLKPKKVLIQLPEGLKQNAIQIAKAIEELGIKVIVSGETCWGGCAIALDEAKAFGVDLIIHFGHAEFIKSDFPIIYVEVKDILDLNPLLKKSLFHLKKYKNIGLSYSIQHRHAVDEIINFYKKNEKEIFLSAKKGRVAYVGHIVGCQYAGLREIESEVDCFVIIGNNFHSLGASLSVNKPVVLLDVYNDSVRDMAKDKEKIIKQRAVAISKLKDAKTVGIIVELKPGQRFGEPKFLLEKLKNVGKEAVVISMSELSNDKLMNFYNIDCFISLACPRIAVDDFSKYEKPIVNFNEAMVALGNITFEELLERGVV